MRTRALQCIDGPVEITLSEGHATDARQGLGKRVWMVSAFRDPERLLGMRGRLSESPQIREGQGQPAVCPGCEELSSLVGILTGVLRAQRKEVKGLTEVTDGEVGLAGSVLGLAFELLITSLDRDCQGTPFDLDGLKVFAGDIPESRADVGQDPSQASMIAEPRRQAFGFTHDTENILVSPEWYEGDPQLESYVDGLREGVGALG